MCWKVTHLLSMKKQKNLGKSVLYLLIASILSAIGSAIMTPRFFSTALGTLGQFRSIPNLGLPGAGAVAIGVFFIVFVGGLFYGWLARLAFTTLGGKGGYFEGLTAVAIPAKLMSIGFLIAAIFTYVPAIGGVVAFLALLIFGVLAYAMLIRASKELFSVDMVTAFVGVTVLLTVSILAVLGASAFGASSLYPGGMPMMGY
ncbi:MAG: YIP1 family protein [Candidatus Aenigmarchaeota archaeon]|nr:YIP1 family protein [Candidatus Aenigmarchaeota archaeon]